MAQFPTGILSKLAQSSFGINIGRILSSFASVLDALNTLRNHGSVAHPNEDIVERAEGELVVNAARTIFHYLSQKMRS